MRSQGVRLTLVLLLAGCQSPATAPPPVSQSWRAQWTTQNAEAREHQRFGRYPEAAAAYAAAIDVLAERDPNDPRVRAVLVNLEGLAELVELRGSQETHAVLMAVLARESLRVYGADDLRTASYRLQHAGYLSGQDELDAAAEHAAAALAVLEASERTEPSKLLSALLLDASLERRRGRLDEALLIQERAHRIAEQSFGAHSLAMASVLKAEARVAFERERIAEGRSLFEQALTIEQDLVPGDRRLGVSQNELAWLLIELGQGKAAEAHARSAVALLEESAPDSLLLAGALDTLAGALVAQERFDEADALYRRALARLDEPDGAGVLPVLTPVVERYVAMLESQGRDDEAAELALWLVDQTPAVEEGAETRAEALEEPSPEPKAEP